MKTILVVCTANVCRSPMAAGILRRCVAEEGLTAHVQVLSAGVWAEDGYGASKNAVTTLRQRSIDLAGHQSQRVTLTLLDKADIVLVMEEAHRRSLFYLAPQHLKKVYLLTEMAGGHEDVADPYGGSLQGYVETADLLESLIDAGWPEILRRLELEA